MKKLQPWLAFILLPVFSTTSWAIEDYKNEEEHKHEEISEQKNDDDHGDDHGKEQNNSGVQLNSMQRQTSQIVVTEAQLNNVPEEIKASGEVVINAYRSTKITPRIAAQVVKRHARLGQRVKPGQILVTLSSVDMAEAQGKLLVSEREWKRVKKLGRKVVSERRYIEAQVTYQQAYAKVIAYGMTKKQANNLLKKQNALKATGDFSLLATQNGTVIKDDFIVGEIIEPGRILYVITDENKLWVEAPLTPEDVGKVKVGAAARVLSGQIWLQGNVVHVNHTLDETTRTLAVVIEVFNVDDQLHPGQFVDSRIQSITRYDVLTIPERATIRSADGDWVVFKELEIGQYRPIEVNIVRTVNNQVVVEGLEPGTRIVTQGVFFLQSELAKSGFDIHNH